MCNLTRVFMSWAPTHSGYQTGFWVWTVLLGLAGLKDEWVRESLVKTLKDFDRLQPKDPSGQAVAAQLWVVIM